MTEPGRPLQGNGEGTVLRFPVPADQESTARVLVDFIEEAGAILEDLQDSLNRTAALAPGERARREVLRFLAGQDGWLDSHDVPPVAALDRTGARALTRRLASEGMVEVDRNSTYPNMASIRISPGGLEELRRGAVAHAMGLLRGPDERVIGIQEALQEALEGLRRVERLICSGREDHARAAGREE